MLVGKWTQSVVMFARCRRSSGALRRRPLALNDPKPLVQDHRVVSVKRWPARPPTLEMQPSLPKSCFLSSPQMQRLLLGDCEWLLHLDFATVVDYYVFKGLVAAVGRSVLDLLHHVLEDLEKQKQKNRI